MLFRSRFQLLYGDAHLSGDDGENGNFGLIGTGQQGRNRHGEASPTSSLQVYPMAIERCRTTNETIIHSDHGVQFTSWGFSERAVNFGLLPSMGTIGDCFDNAVIESFWSRVQVELLDRQSWKTRLQLSTAIFDYIEMFHNRQRRHSTLSMLSPIRDSNAAVPLRARFRRHAS